MKNLSLLFILFLLAITTKAQIGIGTTSPNSTLDVRGSLSAKYTSFSANTTAGSTDNMLVFTGTSAATLTLPDATTMQGRYYWIKNTSSNSSTLTIATTSSQTIDGLTTWTLTQTNKAVRVVSNGTNWLVASESLPGNSAGTAWVHGGNNLTTVQNIGTTSNHDLPFITNNTEKMRLSATGNLGIGTSTFNGSNPEKLLVDAGTTSSYNVISGKGTIDNYLQLNIQNNSSGNSASSDVVATANNGNETVNFIDMGINSSTYNAASFTITGVNDAYLYSTANDLAIGNATANKALKFFTAGTLAANERMRINHLGNVAIGTSTWDGSNPEKLLIDAGTTSSVYPLSMKGTMNGWFQTRIRNNSTGTSASSDFVAVADNGALINMGMNGSGYTGTGMVGGANKAYLWTTGGNDFAIGNASASKYLAFFTGGTATTNERVRISAIGDVGIGSSSFNATYPEQLLVDAGTTGNTNYQNVIVGKGNTNSYAQLNIQNNSTGTAASSDVVATANNGSETVNFIDMGVNGGGNTSAGVLGGANTAYIYATGNDFVIGNSTENKDLIFYTTVPTATSTERMRVTGTGVKISGSVTAGYRSGTGNYTLLTTDYVVINTGAAVTWTLPAASSCAGKMYRLLNHGTGNITLSVAVNTANATTTTNLAFAAGTNYIEIISDGTAWRALN